LTKKKAKKKVVVCDAPEAVLNDDTPIVLEEVKQPVKEVAAKEQRKKNKKEGFDLVPDDWVPVGGLGARKLQITDSSFPALIDEEEKDAQPPPQAKAKKKKKGKQWSSLNPHALPDKVDFSKLYN
jgi:hypothetical protein